MAAQTWISQYISISSEMIISGDSLILSIELVGKLERLHVIDYIVALIYL
jgi:hypothetical protein